MNAEIKSRRKLRGFTLVELLIAVGIMALLGTLASITLNSALNNQERIEGRQKKLEQLALGLQIMRRDIEQITPRIPRDERGDPMASYLIAEQSGENSELEFVHGGRRILPGQQLRSQLERVRYIEEDGALLRLSTTVADPTDSTPWLRQILIKDVKRFEVELFDGERWTSFWPPSTQLQALLPSGFRVQMDVGPWSDIEMNVLLPEAQ